MIWSAFSSVPVSIVISVELPLKYEHFHPAKNLIWNVVLRFIDVKWMRNYEVDPLNQQNL